MFRGHIRLPRRHVPYRGEIWPKYPKTRRQIRNLAEEREQSIFAIATFTIAAFIILAIGIENYRVEHSGSALFIFIVIFIILLIISLMFFDGFRRVNKFREEYDVDISSQHKKALENKNEQEK